MKLSKTIVVIGAGIAGATTAIGLKKLGYDVIVIQKSRPFVSYEGFSQKTKNGLLMMGCENASKLLSNKSLRNSNWANQQASVNYEFVVNRAELDEVLLEDLKKQDIQIINAKVSNVDYTNNPIVSYKKDDFVYTLQCDFVVDSRGRFTPFKKEYTTGVKTVSLLQELELENITQAKTSIDSIKDGWVWQAYVGQNKGYIQFSCDEELSAQINCFEDILLYMKNEDIDLWTLQNYKIKGKLVKRDSFSKVHKTIVNEKMILVGDAASSIDPLSGNGAFQAMSMSSIAPYVINTILTDTKNAKVAIDFYKHRVEFIYKKFITVSKEFYKLEKRFDSDFWKKRQTLSIEGYAISDNPSIKQSAIVKDGLIHPKDVVVTKDNPLGVFFYGNIEIVDIVKYCLEHDFQDSNKFIDSCIKKQEANISLKKWLKEQNIL